MKPRQPESKFVRLIMNGASETEIADATRNWFAYLQILDAIVSDAEHDSRDASSYVRVDGDATSKV